MYLLITNKSVIKKAQKQVNKLLLLKLCEHRQSTLLKN